MLLQTEAICQTHWHVALHHTISVVTCFLLSMMIRSNDMVLVAFFQMVPNDMIQPPPKHKSHGSLRSLQAIHQDAAAHRRCCLCCCCVCSMFNCQLHNLFKCDFVHNVSPRLLPKPRHMQGCVLLQCIHFLCMHAMLSKCRSP